jgi:tetratricopeptide (TPR) repeat protein
MRAKVLQICFALACALGLTAAQDNSSLREGPRAPDPNNASIEGRVVLPSGRSADFNVRITLSNGQSVLTTFFTDKHGEFRFLNLTEGTYYVQAAGDEKLYEPVTERVRLARSQVGRLTLTLRSREERPTRRAGPQVVSAAQLDQVVPAAARKEYERGVKLAARGKLAPAVESFGRAVALYPDYLAARNDLGAQYLKLKRLDEAEAEFRRVLAQDARHFNAQFNLGLVSLERRDYAAAVGRLNQALALDASRPAARLWLGVALLQTGDAAGAERELGRALITGGAETTVANYYLAQIYLRRGDAAGAARALTVYLEDAPKGEQAAEARRLLGEIGGKK